MGATPAQLETLYAERFGHFARVAAAISTVDATPSRLASPRPYASDGRFAAAVRSRRGSGASWFNEARRIAREPRTEPLEAAEHGSSNGQPETTGLREQIAVLPERQRETLFLRYYADLDYRTIAQVLGVEVGTVSATLSAAHRNLRRTIQEAAT